MGKDQASPGRAEEAAAQRDIGPAASALGGWGVAAATSASPDMRTRPGVVGEVVEGSWYGVGIFPPVLAARI